MIDRHRNDDRAVVLFHYRDKVGRRRRAGRWITRIGAWPIELGRGVKVIGRSPGGVGGRYETKLYEVAAVGREGFHLVVDLRRLPRSPGELRLARCVTSWPELQVGWNVITKVEPWLSRAPRKESV